MYKFFSDIIVANGINLFHVLALIGMTYFLHRFSSFFSMAPLVSWATYFTFKGTQATAFLSSY